LYVGANAILSGQELYELPFEHYWRSLSTVPDIPVRGYQMFQSNEHTECGIAIDIDSVGFDNKGTTIFLVSPS
jgi:hypothetical protein